MGIHQNGFTMGRFKDDRHLYGRITICGLRYYYELILFSVCDVCDFLALVNRETHILKCVAFI